MILRSHGHPEAGAMQRLMSWMLWLCFCPALPCISWAVTWSKSPQLLVPSINSLMDHVASSAAEFFTHGKFTNHFTPLEMEEIFGVFLNVIFIFKDTENSFKSSHLWGAWVAQLVERLPSAQVMVLESLDRVPHRAPCSAGSLLCSLTLPPLMCSLSFSLSQINK